MEEWCADDAWASAELCGMCFFEQFILLDFPALSLSLSLSLSFVEL